MPAKAARLCPYLRGPYLTTLLLLGGTKNTLESRGRNKRSCPRLRRGGQSPIPIHAQVEVAGVEPASSLRYLERPYMLSPCGTLGSGEPGAVPLASAVPSCRRRPGLPPPKPDITDGRSSASGGASLPRAAYIRQRARKKFRHFLYGCPFARRTANPACAFPFP